jgi:hypothetical protein
MALNRDKIPFGYETRAHANINTLDCQGSKSIPVSINKTGIDVIRSFYSSDRLQAYPCRFIWHNINKAILEFITWKIGTDES